MHLRHGPRHLMKCAPDCRCRRHAATRDPDMELSRRVKISAYQLGRPKSPEHKQKITDAQRRPDVLARTQVHRGRRRSDQTRRRLSEGNRRHWADPAAAALHREALATARPAYESARRAGIHRAVEDGRWTQRPETAGTRPELHMAEILDAAGIRYEWQHRIGRYVVDFYLPDANAVIEVDGVYWHPNGPDERRDAYLRGRGIAAVHHVTDRELQERGPDVLRQEWRIR